MKKCENEIKDGKVVWYKRGYFHGSNLICVPLDLFDAM
jgi:hypothetical protein